MGIETRNWDAADHLGSTEAVLAYLEQCSRMATRA